MSFLQRLLRRPRSLFLWKLNFQIHLWVGIVLAVYFSVIGISGSILVFRAELEHSFSSLPLASQATNQNSLSIEEVLAKVHNTYPSAHVVSLRTPSQHLQAFEATLFSRGERKIIVVYPGSGNATTLPRRDHNWIDVLADLHATLLAGRKGRIVNGVGGVLLLLINLSGLVIWWPGTKLWKRGFTVDMKRSWRRINFDLHKALGFWSLSFLTIWGLTAVYFGWPRQMLQIVERISPVITARPPAVVVSTATEGKGFDLTSVLNHASQIDPGTTLAEIDFPYSRRAPFEVIMQRPEGPGSEYTDTLYFNPLDGSFLKIWRYGVNESWGDWFLWVQVPLHFGTYWGLGVKMVWAVAGLSLPVLSITGLLLYWNRALRHKRLF